MGVPQEIERWTMQIRRLHILDHVMLGRLRIGESFFLLFSFFLNVRH
jgi:hypothetical protein